LERDKIVEGLTALLKLERSVLAYESSRSIRQTMEGHLAALEAAIAELTPPVIGPGRCSMSETAAGCTCLNLTGSPHEGCDAWRPHNEPAVLPPAVLVPGECAAPGFCQCLANPDRAACRNYRRPGTVTNVAHPEMRTTVVGPGAPRSAWPVLKPGAV
jgi:hypothetical protein